MFQGKRFVTRGVVDGVPVNIQQFLWSLIDELVAKGEAEVDYLQVFELQPAVSGGQKITHTQECPAYFAEYVFDNVKSPVSTKVYVIDDGEYCTMLLPDER